MWGLYRKKHHLRDALCHRRYLLRSFSLEDQYLQPVHHAPTNFFYKYLWSTDHKVIARQFLWGGLLFLLLGLALHFRRQGICTLDDARRQQNRILNTGLLVLAASVVGYLFLTYVSLEAAGIRLGLPWEAGWD